MAVNVVGDFEGGGEVRLSGVLVRQHPNRLSVLREAAHDAEGIVAGAGSKILTHLRGETFAVRVVDWNSVEECTLAAGDVSGQRELLIQDTRQLVKTEAERHPVVRDCQALGRMILTCADLKLASDALKEVQVGSACFCA